MPVKIQILLIGEFRDILRIAARFHGIGGVRIKGLHDPALEYIVRKRQNPLHLVVNNAVVGQLSVMKLIVPAFLLENPLFRVDVRVKHGIEIDMAKIFKILQVRACHRINRLVRIRHCV